MQYGWIVFVFLIAIFVIGTISGKKVKSFEDYATGSGKFGFLLLLGTVVATQWGGGSFLGVSGYGYETLYRGVWYAASTIPRFLIWAFFIAIIMRKVQPYSASEWFALRYDSKSAMLLSIINLIIGLGLLGSQFVAFGNILVTYFDFNLETAIIIGAVIVGIYTIAGGLFAVAVTDFIQLGIVVVSVIGVLVACITKVGTFADLRQILPAEQFDPTNPYGLFFFITIFMLWMADLPLQYVTQRVSSAKSIKIAFYVAIAGAISYCLLCYISPSIGVYAKAIIPDLARPDLAYPTLIKEVLPPALAALATAGLMSAVMSTGDSYLLAPATLMANDFYRVLKPNATPKQSLAAARIFTLVYILLGLACALKFKVILGLSMTFLAVGMALLPAFMSSLCWKKATNLAAFVSMLAGSVINIWITVFTPQFILDKGYANYYYGWVGFVVALVVLVVISLCKPETNKAKVTETDLVARLSA